MIKKIAQIIPLIRLKRDLNYFNYNIPQEFQNQIKIGQIVEIPFRNKIIKGVVLNLSEKSETKNLELKSIHKIIDPLPFLFDWQLKLISDLANYYFVSMSVIVKMMIPEIPQKARLSQNKFLQDFDFLNIPGAAIDVDQYYGVSKPVLLEYSNFEDKIKIYLGLIEKVLKQKKQILIIVPVLADIKKIYQYLGDYQNEISVFLNDLPKNRYWFEWLKIKKGQAKIIIGTRSAIFAPFKNLDLIIIDEEDNENHKQEEPNPRYNVKTVALKLSHLLKSKVIFTALTPSLTALNNAEKKEWQYFEIGKLEAIPQISIIDRQLEFKKGNYSIFSQELLAKMELALKDKKQIFIFLNRKGLATLITCRDCGYVGACPNCKLPLTYHASKELICHHCGYKQDLFLFCPKCQSPNIKITGSGTEKVELETKNLFPQAKVIKIDITTPFKEELKNIDIIIGTQFAFEQIDWQKINLIGVVNADTLFYLPDYRSLEKTFNLLNKLALFLNDTKKELLVQTFSPDNYVFKAFKNLGLKLFYKNEMEERKILNYPPYCRLIKLIYQSIEFNGGQSEVNKVYKFLKATIKNDKIIINPPILTYTQQVRGRFRWLIVLKILDKNISLDFLKNLPEDVIIDPEPESLL